jgi:2Fe-2S ferredoxin
MVVRVEPLGVELQLDEGETLLEAASRHGYYWPTICGGEVECGACYCEITGGDARLEPPQQRELLILERSGRLEPGRVMRLACCVVGTGEGGLLVRNTGVRKDS